MNGRIVDVLEITQGFKSTRHSVMGNESHDMLDWQRIQGTESRLERIGENARSNDEESRVLTQTTPHQPDFLP